MNLQSPRLQAGPPCTFTSLVDFFDWMESQDVRHELVKGTAWMMPWVKRSHSLIASNVSHALQNRLDRKAMKVHQGDFAVATGELSIRYADVMVEPRGADPDARMTTNAILLVEVLSTSTMHIDFGPKQDEYLGLASLQSYLIVAQEKRFVWLWTRGSDGTWPSLPALIEEGDIAIPSLGLSVPMDEIYFDVLDG